MMISGAETMARRAHYHHHQQHHPHHHQLLLFTLRTVCCGLFLTTQVLGMTEVPATETCLDRFGPLRPDLFNRRACATCYSFLFPRGKPLVPLPPSLTLLARVLRNGTQPPEITDVYPPDVGNSSATATICETLSGDECGRWMDCCRAAADCCTRQLRRPRATTTAAAAAGRTRQCPRTWDGFTCWGDTTSGTRVSVPCPMYLAYAIPSKEALKECQSNGTWFSKAGFGWTDYKPCLDKEGYLEVMYAGLSCHVISVFLLCPAIIVFIVFKDLRRQQRVKLHVNFFMSLALSGLAHILWYMLVHHNLFTAAVSSQTVLHKNPVWCRVLAFFKIYLQATNYFWMFCEGYFLHRLISKAFEPPKTLILLYVIGWAFPVLPSISHAIVIATIDNTSCWTRSIGGYQWLVYTPNLLCLVLNLIFLCNILRILLFQLHAHPHEPSNFRRGLKAAFMLIPLFGLQLFLTMYRPNPNSAYVKEYEFFSTVINSSQGVFVSVVFCYFNGEVLNHFRNTCPCCRKMALKRRSRVPSTSVTQYTTYEDDRDVRASVRSRVFSPPSENGSSHFVTNSKETLEMEELARSNGSLSKGKKGGYMPVPTSVANEGALM